MHCTLPCDVGLVLYMHVRARARPTACVRMEAEQCAGRASTGANVVNDEDRPWPIDTATDVPAPFMFDDFLAKHAQALKTGACISLFGKQALS